MVQYLESRLYGEELWVHGLWRGGEIGEGVIRL